MGRETIVMTGGTSGLGAIAAKQFVDARVELLLGARGRSPYPAFSVNLTRLDDVRALRRRSKRRWKPRRSTRSS
jgi:NADP-dependent 3-hydroxy acid dehydrogenase YdfG